MRRLVFCLLLLAPSAQGQTNQGQTNQAQTNQAQANDPDTDIIRRSLGDALSFATFGMISGLGPDTQVTRQGDSYHIHMPFTGLTAPTDPAVTATARPSGDGAWDVQSLAFPSTATIDARGPAAGTVIYAIGKQDITAHIAPGLKQLTTYVAKFGDIRLESDAGKQRARQTIANYAVKGTLRSGGDGRMTMTSSGEMTNWDMSMTSESGSAMDVLTRRMGMDFTVEGLDRAKSEHLRAGLRGLLASLPKPGHPSQSPRPIRGIPSRHCWMTSSGC